MPFSDDLVQRVWEKGTASNGKDPREWRKDTCTAWIRRQDYGRTDTAYGWNIDHITPVSRGGSDALENLQPLHWENNASKSNGRGDCPVRANGEKNVRR